jgi:hypothetical protein
MNFEWRNIAHCKLSIYFLDVLKQGSEDDNEPQLSEFQKTVLY